MSAVGALLLCGASGAGAAPGDLDPTFSDDGLQTLTFADAVMFATDVAVQADGKIVVVGGGYDFAVARFNADGSLDTSFSDDGMVTTNFIQEFDGSEQAHAVAVQANGKIVAAGVVELFADGGAYLADEDFAIARYNADGSLDTSFSGDGKQTTDMGYFDVGYAMAIQADGKIVVTGSSGDVFAGIGNFAVARYNADGGLDNSFSGDGKQTADFGGHSSASAIALQADGRIVVAGSSGEVGASSDFAVARFDVAGTLDTSFSDDGKQTTDFELGSSDHSNAVAIQADGKIVVAGESYDEGDSESDSAVARYNANGTLDTSFSDDGKQTADFELGRGEHGNAVAVQGDGKIVVAGSSGDGHSHSDFVVARYNANGTLDTSFSDDGWRTADFGGYDWGSSVALQTDGKIVVAGGSSGNFAVVRFDAGESSGGGPGPVDSTPPDTSVHPGPSGGTPPGGEDPEPKPKVTATPKPKLTAACKSARTDRSKAQKSVKGAQKKLKAAKGKAAKRKLKRTVTRRQAALRKAAKRARRTCA